MCSSVPTHEWKILDRRFVIVIVVTIGELRLQLGSDLGRHHIVAQESIDLAIQARKGQGR